MWIKIENYQDRLFLEHIEHLDTKIKFLDGIESMKKEMSSRGYYTEANKYMGGKSPREIEQILRNNVVMPKNTALKSQLVRMIQMQIQQTIHSR